MSTTPTFSTQLVGRTEKTLNAILARLLAGTGLTEPQWVTLTLAVRSGGTIDPPLGGYIVALGVAYADMVYPEPSVVCANWEPPGGVEQ